MVHSNNTADDSGRDKGKNKKKYRNALGDGGSAADLCEHARMEEELAFHRGREHYLQVQ
jgi:hypothetical protein